MNVEENEKTFSEILTDIFSKENLQISQLYNLSDMSESDFFEFKRQWSMGHVERRYEITQHLADLSEDSFLVEFSPVFYICLGDEDFRIRKAALDGLWDSSDKKLVDKILNLLRNDPVPEVRAAAARSLTHFLILAQWDQIIGLKIEPIIDNLLAVYTDPDTDEIIKSATLEAMSPISTQEITRHIEEAYESPSPLMQQSALFAMGNSADSKWLPLLMDEMGNPSPEIRGEAVRAVGKIGDSRAIDPLLDLIDDRDEDVALASIVAIGEIGGELALKILHDILQDPDYEDFHEAAEEAIEEAEWNDVNEDLFKLFDFDGEDGSFPEINIE